MQSKNKKINTMVSDLPIFIQMQTDVIYCKNEKRFDWC